MSEKQLSRRLVRRSRHRSRSLAVIVVLLLLVLALVYVGIECVLAALGRPPLLVSPADALGGQGDATLGGAGIAGAVIAAVVGIVLIVIAVTPGRRARHELPDTRMSVVIDDGVLAGALTYAAFGQAHVPAGRIHSVVSRRSGDVRITPTSGQPLDAAAITAVAQRTVDALAPLPALRIAVTVAPHGVVGS